MYNYPAKIVYIILMFYSNLLEWMPQNSALLIAVFRFPENAIFFAFSLGFYLFGWFRNGRNQFWVTLIFIVLILKQLIHINLFTVQYLTNRLR